MCSHIAMLILPIALTVVTNNPIGVGRWCRLRVGLGNLSVQIIVEAGEETFAQVHISNRINTLWEVNTSWHLTVSVSPLVLNTLHMPLIDNDDNLLLWALVNGLEQVLVTLIHEDLLEPWEEDVRALNKPVDHVWVAALLSELSRLRVCQPALNVSVLCYPVVVA